MLLSEIAERIGAELDGPDQDITTARAVNSATADSITFLVADRTPPSRDQIHAGAIIVTSDVERDLFPETTALLRTENPHLGFARTLELLYPQPRLPFEGISANATVDESATLGDGCAVAPHVWIGPGCSIGPGTRLHPGTCLQANVTVGADTELFPNVTVYPNCEIGNRVRIHAGTTIGSDGFGYVATPTGSVKVPHVGRVVIEDDVEIGANSAIDRGVVEDTRIGQGTKIDNLVQVGHNCRIGAHSILCGQVGMAGSAEIGSGVILAGQVGVGGHLKVGDGAVVGAKSGVTADLPPGKEYLGYPAQDAATVRRAMAILYRLPDLRRHVDKISRQLDELLEG